MAKINNFANEITKILRDYTEEIEQGMEEAREKIAKDTVKKLKATSPENTGKYRKSWRVKTDKNSKIIHNTIPISHLLEHGHLNRDGSRTPGIIHIKPVEEEAIKEYIKATENLIRR